MKHQETPLHPSNYTSERLLSDAALVHGGAEVVDGHLHATAAQMIEIAGQHELDKQLGEAAVLPRLALYSKEAITADKKLEDIVDETDKFVEFTTSVADIARPYTIMFNELIPEPSKNDRKRNGDLKEVESLIPIQPIERPTVQGKDIIYTLSGTYTPGEHTNTLRSIGVTVQPKTGKGLIQFSAGYDNGMPKSLDLLLRGNFFEKEAGYITEKWGYLTQFANATRMTRGAATVLREKEPAGFLHIELSDDTITLDAGSHVAKIDSHFAFDREKGGLRLDQDSWTIDHEDFTELVQGMFGFIPTMPVNR